MSSYSNEQDGGYVLPLAPQPSPATRIASDARRITGADLYIEENLPSFVFQGTTTTGVTLHPATGSGAKHVVVNAGSADLLVDSGPGHTILGQRTFALPPGVSLELIDIGPYTWATVGSSEPFAYLTVTDSNYTISTSGTLTLGFAGLTSARTLTLPASRGYGQRITVLNYDGSISQSNYLSISRSGSDTIEGLTSFNLYVPYSKAVLVSTSPGTWVIEEMTPQTYVYSAAGTSSFAEVPGNFIDLDVWGSGGGGGGGALGGLSANGASGGSGGARARRRNLRISELTFPLQVVVGAKGSGAAGQVGTSPANPTAGNLSKVTNNNGSGHLLVQAAGASTSAGGSAGFGDDIIAGGDGGLGGRSTNSYVGQPGVKSTLAAGGGGGGGGINATPDGQAGGAGGEAGTTSGTGGGGTAGAVGAAPNNAGGAGGTNPEAGGDGGGGGAASNADTNPAHVAGVGGAGAWPGGGGGGGGTAITGYGESNGAAGGNGADGAAVISWRF